MCDASDTTRSQRSEAGPAGPPPGPLPRRLRREQRTVALMIGLYCRHHHGGGSGHRSPGRHDQLCDSCAALLDYADLRVQECRFGAAKPTCARCTVHCFRPRAREDIRNVMRYSGPRMAMRHPYLAFRHLLDRR